MTRATGVDRSSTVSGLFGFALLSLSLYCVPFSAPAEGADYSERTRADVAHRLRPAGSVCVVGDPCASTRGAIPSANTGTRTGEQVYQFICFSCHDTGASGAATLDEHEKWVAKQAARTVAEIYQSAIGGRNAMPPRGNCTDCSDDEIRLAVDYMLERVR